ncbi:hypothetical protein TIFTF001_013209 [Ficus carica]|uniref:Uncharacterized protein n=1 Tax=Ficus carica TaxID=3494 RepID=A0AA88A0G8_FICCA|nr:hypothetical protein TIFTF001_013209 [Ficus carica]
MMLMARGITGGAATRMRGADGGKRRLNRLMRQFSSSDTHADPALLPGEAAPLIGDSGIAASFGDVAFFLSALEKSCLVVSVTRGMFHRSLNDLRQPSGIVFPVLPFLQKPLAAVVSVLLKLLKLKLGEFSKTRQGV